MLQCEWVSERVCIIAMLLQYFIILFLIWFDLDNKRALWWWWLNELLGCAMTQFVVVQVFDYSTIINSESISAHTLKLVLFYSILFQIVTCSFSDSSWNRFNSNMVSHDSSINKIYRPVKLIDLIYNVFLNKESYDWDLMIRNNSLIHKSFFVLLILLLFDYKVGFDKIIKIN